MYTSSSQWGMIIFTQKKTSVWHFDHLVIVILIINSRSSRKVISIIMMIMPWCNNVFNVVYFFSPFPYGTPNQPPPEEQIKTGDKLAKQSLKNILYACCKKVAVGAVRTIIVFFLNLIINATVKKYMYSFFITSISACHSKKLYSCAANHNVFKNVW